MGFPSRCNDAEICAAFLVSQIHVVQGIGQVGFIGSCRRGCRPPRRNLAVGFYRVVGAFQILQIQIIGDARRAIGGAEGLGFSSVLSSVVLLDK